MLGRRRETLEELMQEIGTHQGVSANFCTHCPVSDRIEISLQYFSDFFQFLGYFMTCKGCGNFVT